MATNRGQNVREMLIAAAVRNLREYGYPACDERNILTDEIYSAFFRSMLNDNTGNRPDVDAAIMALLAELPER